MKVIGIDPGTIHVGYGVVEEKDGVLRCLDSGSIDAEGDDVAQRLVGIHRALQVVMREWKPEVAAVESVFFGKNVKSAIKIGEGRGIAILSAAEAEVPVVGYEPALVKRAVCGNGRASKRQIQEMVRVRLCLEEIPHTDHEADALALAICHINRSRMGFGTGKRALPEAVLKALGGKVPKKRRRKPKNIKLR
jgi:crossover junction endodeoxyribonuclease RuvC